MASFSRPVQCDPAPQPAVIHVVDDDPGFRSAIGDLLRACDYRVELHESATGLLEKPPGDEPACIDRKSTRLNSSHIPLSRMPSSA